MQPTTDKSQLLNRTAERARKRSLLIWLLLLLGVATALNIYRQDLYDWWRLRGYRPSPAISLLASRDTMTAFASRIYYVNHPELLSKAAFRQSCPAGSQREQTIVLGCYQSGQSGIFLLDVTDPRLQGVEEVTAAHEMLHAAYDRLSSKERAVIDGQLLDFYNRGLSDSRIRSTIEAYRKTEPNDLTNEMHSVFGTEVGQLPPPLEQYYKRYFTDRSAVVKASQNYQAEFTSRQVRVQQYDRRLANLKNQIDSLESELKSLQSAIQSRQTEMQALRTSDPAGYNSQVPAYNAQVDRFNNGVSRLRNLIDEYNKLVSERNSVALEENELANALNANVQQIK